MNRSTRFPRVRLLILPILLLLLFLPAISAAGDDDELVDVKSSTIGEEITTEFLEEIPNGRIYFDAVALVAGVAGVEAAFIGYQDILQVGPIVDTSFHVHGADRTDNIYFVDGVETTNVASGSTGMIVPWEAIESVEVLTGGLPAEYGRATGGVVNVLTRSGGNEFHGSLPIHYTDDNLAQSQDEDRGRMAGSDFRDLEWGASLGGPVVRDHLWFFAAYNQLTHSIEGIAYEETIKRDDLFQEGLLKLTWQVNEDHKLQGQYAGSPTEMDYHDTLGDDVPSLFEAGDQLWKLEWNGIITPDLLIEARVASHNSNLSLGPKYGSWDDPRIIDEMNGAGRTVSGNISSIYDLDLPRTQYQATLDWYVGDRAGDHNFKFGAEYQDLEYDESIISPDTYTINQPDSTSDRWVPRREMNYLDKGSILTLFAQDAWTVHDNWTFNLGLRWEKQEQKNDVGEQVYSFDNLISPRLGMAWDVQGDGLTRLFAHYGRYYQAVGLQLATHLHRQREETYFYDGDYETGDWTPIDITYGPENPNQVDGDLDPNYKDEVIVGYEFEFATDFAAGARVIYNRQSNMMEDVLANEDEIRQGMESESIYYLTNVEQARRSYRGLELQLQKRLSNNYQFLAVYTLSESKGSVAYDYTAVGWSEYADIAETYYNRYGQLPWDDRHYLKVNGSYHLPLGFIIGGSLNWRSGRPYNRIGDLPEGVENVQGYNGQYYLDPRGSHSLGSVWWLDLRLRKDFEIGPTMLSITADAFNLTNNQTVSGRYETEGDHWGEADSWMRAGYFVLGGKLTF